MKIVYTIVYKIKLQLRDLTYVFTNNRNILQYYESYDLQKFYPKTFDHKQIQFLLIRNSSNQTVLKFNQ